MKIDRSRQGESGYFNAPIASVRTVKIRRLFRISRLFRQEQATHQPKQDDSETANYLSVGVSPLGLQHHLEIGSFQMALNNHAIPTMHPNRWNHLRALPTALLVFGMTMVIANSTGCSTLLLKPKTKLDKLDMTGLKMEGYSIGEYGAQRVMPVDENNPSIVLEVNNGKRHFERIPMVQGQPLFVADMLRDAQLQKKLGRLRATILRPSGTSKPPIRLEVDFDGSGKNVMEGMNYSLRPGDHVVVSVDDSSFLTSMLPELPFMKR